MLASRRVHCEEKEAVFEEKRCSYAREVLTSKRDVQSCACEQERCLHTGDVLMSRRGGREEAKFL